MIETLIAFVTGYIIYKILSLFIEVRVVSEEEVNKFQDLEFQEPKNIIICKIEKHNDILYVWNVKDDTFMVQGKDMDEVVQFFVKNHPNTKVLFNKGDLNGVKI
jgi:hypothetical protein